MLASMIRFYGASDDLVEIEGTNDEKGCDEYPSDGKGESFVVTGDGGGMIRVRAYYDGCWAFSVGLFDEGVPIPPWEIKIETAESGYSTLLTINSAGEPMRVIHEAQKRNA